MSKPASTSKPATGSCVPVDTVDVVLPLAVPGAFTYQLPAALAEQVVVGSRVVVPLGKRKYYTAIVIRRPGTFPVDTEGLKPVADLVDAAPLILPRQLDFWRWMANYYMCTPGEVMKAALPSGLKLESETRVSLAEGFTEEDEETLADAISKGEENAPSAAPQSLSPRQHILLQALRTVPAGKSLTIDELLKKCKAETGLLPALRRLIEDGIVQVSERLSRAYRPRTASHLRLAPDYQSEAAQHALLDALKRSPRQAEIVMALIAEPQLARAEVRRRWPGSESALATLRRKGVVDTFEVAVDRLTTHTADPAAARPVLNAAQQAAHDAILREWEEKDVCLLHGVTSSGKTEIYTSLIRRTLDAGRQVLYLVPEIALTTQITTRLGRVFGSDMGVYHSKFPDVERVELWQRQLTSRAFPLILGVRSSLFLPFSNLGLVIVDEEHETSYKQQDPAPRYNARDAAIVLARLCGAKVLLGTATPAVESYYNATVSHKYGYVALTERFGGVQLPQIFVEDVKELRRKKQMTTPFSPRLTQEINHALAEGEQAILFQNRRGYAPVLECRKCGWTPRCTACDVPLTYHRQASRLVCHYCGASYPVPTLCPNCEEPSLHAVGIGTEKIEESVATCFPAARVARMDLDTTRIRSAYEQIIRDFQTGQTDVLIGTQMVTKGLDFDRVRVVGILNADQMLSVPNFRAYERAFQMMAQVAGRAGRRGRQGIVVLQTRQPDIPLVHQVVAHDYAAMFAQQLREREAFRYPPFVRLIDIYLKHRDESTCAAAAEAFAALLHPHFADALLGPDSPAVSRVQYLHIRKLVLKVALDLPIQGVRRTLLAARRALIARPAYRSVNLFFDVDPL